MKVTEDEGQEEVKITEGEGQEEVKVTEGEGETEEIDIDLDDPEVEKAAEKIQASFKGFKARKEVNAMRVGQRS